MQLNRRIGKLQWNLNYTFSRTIVYNNASADGRCFSLSTRN